MFNIKDAKTGRLQNVCRSCQKLAGKNHYHNNRDVYIKRAKSSNQSHTMQIYKNILEYFKIHFCIDCGEKDPLVLEFDHQENKVDNIASMVSKHFSWEVIKEEISKCFVRCANCHKRRHKIEGNYAIYKLLQLELI